MTSGYGFDPFGEGPYGSVGGVLIPPPHPPGGGYGTMPYGTGPYGGVSYPHPIPPVTDGYGGIPYGHGSYGSISLEVGEVTGATSISGFQLEVLFSTSMIIDATLLDPASYTVTDIAGAAPTTVLSVQVGVEGDLGATSVILTTTGTTLGGTYDITVVGPKNVAGTPIEASHPNNTTTVLTRGEPPDYVIDPSAVVGNEITITFDTDMLPEAGFSPGIEDTTAYKFIQPAGVDPYPVEMTVLAVEHPYMGDLSKVNLTVQGMTSVAYQSVISPADAVRWDGDILPSAAASFIGTEIGTGTSSVNTTGLLLSKGLGGGYGWEFSDTTGKVLPGSSYRADVTIDVSAAVIAPTLFDTVFATWTVSDGAVEATITLTRVAGLDFVEVSSGAFFVTGALAWSNGFVTVSLVRNQKADTYTVVVNDNPFVAAPTASFTGAPTIAPGARFILDPGGVYAITNLPLKSVLFTSSQTVFSGAWNFLHGTGSVFTGSPLLTRDNLLTKKGPLVKGWGDATPATKQDVEVRINGVPVEVDRVNPYLGKIFPTIPIPLMPPGAIEVEVDYIWFCSPPLELAGLNTPGLVLNKYDLHPGNNIVFSSGVGLPGGGSTEGERFPFGVVLGPREPRKPLLISHRYIAYEKEYTASLNSPTTLLLNRSNHTVALPAQKKAPEGAVVAFLGNKVPTEADPVWVLTGVDANPDPAESNVTSVYTIVDDQAGSYGQGDVAMYSREEDLSFASTITIVTRFQSDKDDATFDGVFSGVGFGVHNNQHLYLVGALLVNDVQHVAMLVEPSRWEDVESWQIAFTAPIQIETTTTFSIATENVPALVRSDAILGRKPRFQILDGTQAGVYEIDSVADQTDGTTTVTVVADNPFPNNPTVFGNAFFDIHYESKWDDGEGGVRPSTYRLVVKSDVKGTPEGRAELYIGGTLDGLALTLEGAPRFSRPPDIPLLLPVSDKGQVFFGSVSRKAANASDWSFYRYGIEPDRSTFHFRGIVAAAEMNDLPEDDPNNIWFFTQKFGESVIDATADTLLLKGTSSNEVPEVNGLDLTFGYGRIEPFLTRRMNIDVDAKFRVDSGILGAGDAEIIVRDDQREVRLSTLLYEETGTRQLLNLPSVSLSGLLLPDLQGWGKTGSVVGESVQGQRIEWSQATGETVAYIENFSDLFPDPLPSKGRILEARFAVPSLTTTAVTGDTGIIFGTDADDPGSERGVGLALRVPVGGDPARVVMFSVDTGADVTTYDFDWQDGEFHTYRVLIDPDLDAVTTVLDDVVVGTVPFTSFAVSSTADQIVIGLVSAETVAEVELDSFSVVVTPPVTAKRTLGVWLGGDPDEITNWKIPRTDGLSVPNDDPLAVIEEMDWRVDMLVRIHRDVTWGVTILRPDLPPPPFFTGNFATQITEPSAGWINVEYRDLPLLKSPLLQGTKISLLQSATPPPLGFVAFGALDPRSISQQRWDEVRYRVYEYPNEDLIAPHHMVLNQYNVISSGELTEDITIEEVEVVSVNNFTVNLRAANITADRVFNLQYEDIDGNTVVLPCDQFTFDRETQILTLNGDLTFRPLAFSEPGPSPEDDAIEEAGETAASFLQTTGFVLDSDLVNIPVIVRFNPGKPVTKTYLCSQPLENGITNLNEGTPPYPKHQTGTEPGSVTFGSKINDPHDTLTDDPDFILNDPYRSIEFDPRDPNDRYECLEFCEVTNEGKTHLLSAICDDSCPGSGWIEMALEGVAFHETELFPLIQDGPNGGAGGNGQGGGVPNVFLHAMGGAAPPGGTLNNTILFPPPSPSGGGAGPPVGGPGGTVQWSVWGTLYDTVSGTTTPLYFDKQTPFP